VELSSDLPPGGTLVAEHELAWDAWHPREVAGLLAGVTVPWYVAGGWALDLFRGCQTREHSDLEIAVPATAEAYEQIRSALAGYEFEAAGDGRLWPADGRAFELTHQTWVSELAPGKPRGRIYRLDVFREPHSGGRWACRRDERIQLPYQQVICRDRAGIPYLAPELALFFKAKHARPKDEADLAMALPLVGAAARGRLVALLELVHPGHRWLEAL
jgi:hypothetical protein